MRVFGFAALAALAVCSWGSAADAFCRTTSCGPGECTKNAQCGLCLEGGLALYWPSRCLSFAVHEQGSELRGISAETARAIISKGFASWIAADCGGGQRPGLEVLDLGTIDCGAQEYDDDGPNANVWAFEDGEWPHAGPPIMLALTTVTYDVTTGEILDADVAINALNNPLTTGESQVVYDLQSIVTHEAGHVLGISHSCDTEATMFPAYQLGSTGLRSLAPDDFAAICDAFPAGSDKACNPTPRGGFSPECSPAPADDGCRAAAPGPAGSAGFAGVALALAAALRRIRRGVVRGRTS